MRVRNRIMGIAPCAGNLVSKYALDPTFTHSVHHSKPTILLSAARGCIKAL